MEYNDEMIFAFNEKQQIVMFRAPDILYIEEGKNYFTVRTFQKSTHCSFPSYDIFELLDKHINFRFVNNGLMANMNLISAYDPNNNTMFFNEDIRINAVSASIKYVANNVAHAIDESKLTKSAKLFPFMP